MLLKKGTFPHNREQITNVVLSSLLIAYEQTEHERRTGCAQILGFCQIRKFYGNHVCTRCSNVLSMMDEYIAYLTANDMHILCCICVVRESLNAQVPKTSCNTNISFKCPCAFLPDDDCEKRTVFVHLPTERSLYNGHITNQSANDTSVRVVYESLLLACVALEKILMGFFTMRIKLLR